MTGLVITEDAFQPLAGGKRIGDRRLIGPVDAEFLTGLNARYVTAVAARAGHSAFAGLGLELFRWLDGAAGLLTRLLEQAPRPVLFEIQSEQSPSPAGWALLRAPWELLAAPAGGLLAADPVARFGVLRRLGAPVASEPLDSFRLGLAFMASSPRGQVELDFEAEEAAILAAVGESEVDLLVDDTGDPEQLAGRLERLGAVPVVHLSCRGLNRWPAGPGRPQVPVLMMEDQLGEPVAVPADALAGLMPAGLRLMFVSACLTATSADAGGLFPAGDGLVAHSLATTLVSAGVPAVIGWDGSVSDRASTVFAEHFYGSLASRSDIAVAVADARRALLSSGDWIVRRDWHLARLWLGPAGGGPVVGGSRKRSPVTARHGTKTFLDHKHQVPVAAAEMFVGRRPELQYALRVLRSGDKAGVLLHGQGRLGKSSLAARIADRCPDYALGVVFGDYSAAGILAVVADARRDDSAVQRLIESRLAEVRDRPEAIEAVLAEALARPTAADGEGDHRPLLLVIDDLEQVLEPDLASPHRVTAEVAPVLAGVLRAFDPAVTDSRLLVTSRFTFAVDGLESRLEPVQLPPLSAVAQVKLQRRQQAVTALGRPAGRDELARRALAVSRGNPGLQDLIGLRLVYGEHVSADRAEAAVAGMEAYLDQGSLPADPEVRAFLENLALDTLLQQAGPAGTELIRAATVFTVPVPEAVIGVLAGQDSGLAGRLRGLGLMEGYQDLHNPDELALIVDPLASGRLAPLTAAEEVAYAAASLTTLFTAWGGARARRGETANRQLTRLALLADDPHVTAACAAATVYSMLTGPAADALSLGRDAISLLDRHRHSVPPALFRRTADAALTSGDGPAGESLLERAATLTGACELEEARLALHQGRLLITQGELDQAGQALRRATELFTAAGSEREAAVAWGDIAVIAHRRGDYDEELRIRREVQLPVYERFGDLRSAAGTWGGIASIAFARGDYDEALRIRREVQLPILTRLGLAGQAAVAWGNIADIAYKRGDYDEVLRIRREVQLPVFERLGDARETALTWGGIANIAYQRGDYDEALRIRRQIQLPAYEQLGDRREIALTWGGIADIAFRRGDYDAALRIRREFQLPVYEQLGDRRELALTWGGIADIAYRRRNYAEAAELHQKRLEVYRELGDRDGIAHASWGLAQVHLARKDRQSAIPPASEAFQIYVGLQRAIGVATVGPTLGRLLLAAGHPDAPTVLAQARTAAEKLNRPDLIQTITNLQTGPQQHP